MADLDEFDDGSEGFKSIRKAYNKLKTDHEATTEQLAKFLAKETKATLESVLASKGINPLFADFYHDEDKSEAAVTAWAEKYKAVLPQTPPAEGAPAAGETPEVPGATTSPEDQAAAKVAQLLGTGVTGTTGPTLQQQMDATNSPEELTAVLRAARIAVNGV